MTYGAEKKKLVHLDKDIAMIQFRDIRREIYDILCIYVARIYIYICTVFTYYFYIMIYRTCSRVFIFLTGECYMAIVQGHERKGA